MGYFPEDDQVVDRLQREIGKTNHDKGFRGDWELADKLERTAREIRGEANRWGAVNVDPTKMTDLLIASSRALRINILGMKLALAHSEVSEMLENLRDEGLDIDAAFAEEGVDVIIRVLDVLDMASLPAGGYLVEKIKKNKDRPSMHGRQA